MGARRFLVGDGIGLGEGREVEAVWIFWTLMYFLLGFLTWLRIYLEVEPKNLGEFLGVFILCLILWPIVWAIKIVFYFLGLK